MKATSVKVTPTNNPAIVKFETDFFLINGKGFEFQNVEEATSSPLAQQLFYLPFIKTVYIAQNFIALEKYDIIPWAEVQDELAEQIANYLDSGQPLVKLEKEENKTLPVTVYVESTPNPKVMKFVANKKLVIHTAEFKNIGEAKNAPLAQALFHFPFVEEVFMDKNYISINKYANASWDEITLELREFIQNYLQEGKPIVTSEAIKEPSLADTEAHLQPKTTDPLSKEIISILEEYVKPAVARDGGNIQFESYNPSSKCVKVILQGACSGCPSSTMTLKNGIENMLKEMLPGQVETVEAING